MKSLFQRDNKKNCPFMLFLKKRFHFLLLYRKISIKLQNLSNVINITKVSIVSQMISMLFVRLYTYY
ncbi:hypothetical protein BCE33L3368 [Bacillus cereus E33L]|uniref:Uncharacterized protein n=1 Tax=Bacillus cereus (strain ZK / E33L) TaxID=288681 RepID=Q637G5_BACCZ|nr:hypothetical protein BCE33L3368 [Bacillus cereus E33L]